MKDDYEILKLRVLLCFLKNDDDTCTVGGISKTLSVMKQRVSRVLMDLEKEGWVDRSDTRHPFLTREGQKQAKEYSDRILISLNHLLFEGVSLEKAQQDAYHWALYNTDETMKVIKSAEARYRAKYELRDRKEFNGSVLCKQLGDGVYPFNFVLYREHIKNGSNLSMANAGFEHPGHLVVKGGVGKVQLHAINIVANSPVTKKEMTGKVDQLRYFDHGSFTPAEISGDVITFPAEAITFVNIGEDINQMLHGSVCLRIRCSINPIHMPESVSIFNIII